MKSYCRGAQRTFFVLCTLHLAFFLAGCYSYSHQVDLNRDGSGTLRVQIEHEQIHFFLDGETVRERDVEDCQEASYHWGKIQGVEMRSCQSWIEDFRVFEEAVYSFNDVSLLSTQGWSFSWQREGSYKVFTMDYETGEGPPTEDVKAKAREEMAGFRGASFSVTLPKEISEAPGAAIGGRTATWDHTWQKIIDEGITELHMEARVKLNFWQRLFGW